ncbi:MAG: RNase adapter RapZ [Myxococcota bacterium]|jgi:RNase adapter protein RapZ|nr:RNase adapter RapZ [Myxococcota bacterium]
MSEVVQPRVVFVAGLSGSGKSTAMAALEDLGFYCIDNLPTPLIGQFIDLCAQSNPAVEQIALAVDAREQRFLQSFPDVVKRLRSGEGAIEVLFLDCSDEVIEKRYRETRRVHPLSPEGSVADGVSRERALLADAAGLADQVIDTTGLNVHQLKSRVVGHVLGESRPTVISLVSFGFRYGTPPSVELLFDMRFLPNPYFDADLRARSGLDGAVSDYVLESERGKEFLGRLKEFIAYMLPLYDKEGKAYVTVGIGCTGGRHRSVAMTEALKVWLQESDREVNVLHRDVEKS